MSEKSTIQLRKQTIRLLKQAKRNERQTYDELLETMTRHYLKIKERNQYDEFLHKIQQPKMKELWDNSDDEAWEHA